MENRKSLNEFIEILNYKYQIVKKNKHWNYNMQYNFNGYEIYENDMLLSLSERIINSINITNLNLNSLEDYEIPNITYLQMKEIVINFFIKINPEYKDKLELIFSKIKVISNSKEEGRSISNIEGIKFYYNNKLSSLVTLAHEVSHSLANLDENNQINNKNKIGSFSEIESEMTEELFLQYLIDSNIMVIDKKSKNNIPRIINNNDLKCIKYCKLRSTVELAYRALEEIPFKRIMEKNKFNDINEELLNEICTI